MEGRIQRPIKRIYVTQLLPKCKFSYTQIVTYPSNSSLGDINDAIRTKLKLDKGLELSLYERHDQRPSEYLPVEDAEDILFGDDIIVSVDARYFDPQYGYSGCLN